MPRTAPKIRKKKVVELTPTKEQPIPYSPYDDEKPNTRMGEIEEAVNTAELMEALGADHAVPEMDEATASQTAELLEAAVTQGKTKSLTEPAVAFAAKEFLRNYGSALALDVATARTALTNKLMEIADCGDTKFELRAIELLGKHSDIGLFTERSEVTVNYNSPEKLESEILKRVDRLLHAQGTDIPLVSECLEELSMEEAEFTEVEQSDE